MPQARAYNYPSFPPDSDVDDFLNWADHLHVGDPAPDPPLIDLATGNTTYLSTFSQAGLTIVEFGSLT